jgi:hypothetical protein
VSTSRWRRLGPLVTFAVLAGALALRSDPGPPAPSPAELAPADLAPTAPGSPAVAGGELTWDGVDLQQVRAALPDNLYWELALPTDDPELQRLRQADAAARNVLFGAIQSGNATEEEIHTYYAEREQISRDYMAFAEHVLLHHGEQLADRDRGLLELAREMNEKRLAQLPGELERALARKVQQDQAREAWSELTTSKGGP